MDYFAWGLWGTSIRPFSGGWVGKEVLAEDEVKRADEHVGNGRSILSI